MLERSRLFDSTMKANTTAAFIGSLLATSMPFHGSREADAVDPPPFGYTAGSPQSVANMKSKIKNVVWLLLENRSFDNILGGIKLPGLDNPANKGDVCNPVDVTKPTGATLCTRLKDFDSIANDPDHSITGNNFQFYGTFSPNNADISSGRIAATNQGFVNKQTISYPTIGSSTAAAQVMGYYSEDEIRTMVDLVGNFSTFNYWFSCVPGPTNPNRACALSGTSAGHGSNDASFTVGNLTVNSIFQELTSRNISWLNYDGTGGAFPSDALFYASTRANSRNKVVPINNFFQDALMGRLPTLSYLNPSCCGLNTDSMHPTGQVSFGLIFVKQIYDALRQGPQWNETMFVLTYDESGGFHDHVPSPLAVRPDTLTYSETAHDGSRYTFQFDRLGGRMPTLLISPYTPQGHVENMGTNPETGATEAYSATSVLKTLGLLFDFDDFTPRVANSPSFDHLIGLTMRKDAPMILTPPVPFPNDT
ncbi:Phosphatidylglycerol specific phospholipase C [Mycena kentingensis (nom. inval.)]|nr:Phosphatidylglycerol specific phospholipase C [Mycena kentingensis (nom. inval.)]